MCAEAQRLEMIGQSVHGEVREMRKQGKTESRNLNRKSLEGHREQILT